MKEIIKQSGLFLTACAMLSTAAYLAPVQAQGARLEEVVVTAQRREQATQDVPVSLEVFTGDALSRLGVETLHDLAAFAPGMVVRDMGEEQGLLVRGGGTQSKNLAIEQGVPTFVDGIYYGRGSQVKGQFLDLERIELLKGPQPVFFGQNAGAGALNMTSRNPTPEWEGYLQGELGNHGSREVEGAVGGPITDTLGIRVAGRYDTMEGYMKDFFTGKAFPEREAKVGRATLLWTPNDKLQVTAKLSHGDSIIGPQAWLLVRDAFPLDERQGVSVYVSGIETVSGVQPFDRAPGDFSHNIGVAQIAPYLSPNLFPGRIIAGNGPLNANGNLDMSGWTTNCSAPGVQLFDRFENCLWDDDGRIKTTNTMLDVAYEFDNGIQANWKSGFTRHLFWNSPQNTGGPFITNPRGRDENSSQWATELRLTSPTDGVLSWMVGVSYMIDDLDLKNHQANADGQRQIRGSITSADSEWTSGFATLTYNFFDDKASIDLGARYTYIDKYGKGRNYAGMFIVEHPVTGVPTVMPLGRSLIGNNFDRAAGYDVIALAGNPNGFYGARIIGRTPYVSSCAELAQYQFALVCAAGSGATTVAVGAGTVEGGYKETNLDPQVVLRYRPSDDISLYGKWVKSTKGGGFDAGVTEITRFISDWTFGPEKYESFEAGVRGEFFDGRVRADLTAYRMNITGQQVSNLDQVLRRNVTQNIAASRTKGIEASMLAAVTDRLTANVSVSLMDNEITNYPNSICTIDERATGRCAADNTIDRSGSEGVGSPPYQFTVWANYELPTFLDRYRSNFSATYTNSDAYVDNRNFTRTVSYDKEDDLSLSLEVGDLDENWVLSFWARNLFEMRPTLFSELDLAGDGVISSSDGAELGNSAFTTYGITFRLNLFK